MKEHALEQGVVSHQMKSWWLSMMLPLMCSLHQPAE